MAGDDSESGEHLEDLPTLRSQRRFLEVMSLVCTAYYWFHIRINTEGSLLGQSIHIGSTRYALAALWIGLVWAGWRYCQQLYRAWRDLSTDLHKDFKLELSRLANRVVGRYLSRMALPERRTFGDERGKAHFRGIAGVERFNSRRARRYDAQGKEVAPKLPSGPLCERSHTVILTTFDWLYEDAGTQHDYDFGIGRFQAASLLVGAAIAAGIRRPAVFDYVTPALMFLFAALSLVLATIQHPAIPEPYDMKERCGRTAREWFQQFHAKDVSATSDAGYENHYNAKLNRCFARLTANHSYRDSTGRVESTATDEWLYDINENLLLGMMSEHHVTGSAERIVVCYLRGKACGSVKEWHDAVRPEMQQ